MKKSFVLYTDSFDTLQHLSDDQLGKLTRLIYEFVINGEVPAPSNPLFFVFNPIKTQLIRDSNKYETIRDKRSLAGKLSAEKKQHMLTHVESVEQDSTKSTVSVNVSDSASDNVSVNESVSASDNKKENIKKVTFKNWTEQQFKDDIKLHRGQSSVDTLIKFFDYWNEKSANGKMKFQSEKTWETKKRLARWELNNNKPKTTTQKQPYQPPTEQPRSSQNNINQLNQQ
jgi:hypothetical protein